MFNKIRSLVDSMLGRNIGPAPAISRPLFAISNALLEQEARLDVQATGFAALAFRNVESSMFGRLEKEIEELVQIGAAATGTQIELKRDQYNYLWLLMYDEEFEDLVATMHLASSMLEEHDFGRTLLAAAFQFTGPDGMFFWLYNFKRGLFYPFAPRPNRARDQTLEMRLKSLMATYLPLENDPARWYPLWDIPGDPNVPRKQLRRK